jgi:hypothetical protein
MNMYPFWRYQRFGWLVALWYLARAIMRVI